MRQESCHFAESDHHQVAHEAHESGLITISSMQYSELAHPYPRRMPRGPPRVRAVPEPMMSPVPTRVNADLDPDSTTIHTDSPSEGDHGNLACFEPPMQAVVFSRGFIELLRIMIVGLGESLRSQGWRHSGVVDNLLVVHCAVKNRK